MAASAVNNARFEFVSRHRTDRHHPAAKIGLVLGFPGKRQQGAYEACFQEYAESGKKGVFLSITPQEPLKKLFGIKQIFAGHHLANIVHAEQARTDINSRKIQLG